MGAGAAKTGLFWMREGGEGEELSLAKTDGRNVVFLIREDWEAGEIDEMHHPLHPYKNYSSPTKFPCQKILVYAHWPPHGSLQRQAPHILPVLLQQ